MNKLHNIIRDITPYSIIRNHKIKSLNLFLEEYRQWVESGKCFKLDTVSNYRQIISVQGFGYSGSGAVVDLLREYPSCQVWGGIDEGIKC